jgi:5-formyltetrahydrofolate cyclo-ligase
MIVDIRKEILSKRDELSVDEISEKSHIIIDALKILPEFINSVLPMIYVSFRSEVFTHDLIKERLKNNLNVTVPLTISREKRLVPYKINDFSSLKKGYYGIPEPDSVSEKAVNPADIDCVIVPGSVFDRRGGRYGYGGGFYDRFFGERPKAVKIGLAFELQVQDFISLKDHDVKMDIIVIENGIINTLN